MTIHIKNRFFKMDLAKIDILLKRNELFITIKNAEICKTE